MAVIRPQRKRFDLLLTPTHRDRAAMNGAHALIPDWVQSLVLEFDEWATCLVSLYRRRWLYGVRRGIIRIAKRAYEG